MVITISSSRGGRDGKGVGRGGGGGAGLGCEGEGNLMCHLRSGGPSSLFLWPLCLFAFRSPPKKKKKQKQKKPTPDPRLLEVGLSSLSIRNNLFIFSPKKFDQAT